MLLVHRDTLQPLEVPYLNNTSCRTSCNQPQMLTNRNCSNIILKYLGYISASFYFL